MKIVCEDCGARYSIADEKVGGRAFRIRCKKCGQAIVVCGAAATEDAVRPAADAIWYVVVEGEQQGPLPPEGIARMLAAGSVDRETWVWREGLAQWLRLGEVDELGQAAPPSARASSEPSRRADLFAPSAAGDDVSASASAPAMTGARSESSVLFSLGNLQALAMRGQAASRPVRGVGAGGSGLLDIRALAASAQSSAAGPARGVDDLLSIGGAAAFSAALGAPVLAPVPTGSGRLLRMLVAVAALLLVGVIGLLVLVVARPAQARVAFVPPIVVPPYAPRSPAEAPAPPPAVATSSAHAPVIVPANQADAPAVRENTRRRPTDGHTPVESTSGVAPDREPARGPEEQASSAHSGSLEELVRQAVDPTAHASAVPVPPPPHEAPARSAQPSRADVRSALAAVQGPVRACAGGRSGTADIRFVFAPSGHVTTATVTSQPFAGTPAGSCMARAARAARVPPFSSGSLAVNFPFVVR